MSQNITTSWLSTNVAGAYVQTQVISSPSGLASSGVVLIMGEAAGGPDYTKVTLANNFFKTTQYNQVKAIYTSGPIVDAFSALTAPSNDTDISGTPSSVYIVKTNRGAQASALVPANTSSPSTYGTFIAQNWGVGGNLFNFTVTSLDAEAPPTITGTTIASYSGLSGASFTVRVNGGPATLITPTGTITDRPSLLTSLNNAFIAAAVNLDATAGTAANTISINWSGTSGSASPVADAFAYSKGWGKSFELIDSTPGDLAALGLMVGLYTSSQEPAVEVQIINSSAGVNQTLNVAPAVSLFIGYQGTTATLTINSTMLTTTVTGGSGANLSITLNQYTTVAQLAAFINTQPGYSASASPAATQLPTSSLDQVTAIGIASSTTDEPGRVKNSVYAFEKQLATSTSISFTNTAVAGIPGPGALTYLSGGLLGGTLAADIVNAIAQMGGIQVNIIVPLFSQDATADILAGNTDPSSTYTINAINELLKSHCIQYSTPTLKRNRMAICSFNGTFAQAMAQAQTLATYRVALTCQQATQINSLGVSTLFLPWYAAVVAAGTQEGGFYKSITNHSPNLISYQDPSGLNSGDPESVSEAITAGLLVLTLNGTTIEWSNDQTTYGLDSNFVYNSIQAIYLSDILALDFGSYLQSTIVGKSLADINAGSILSSVQQRFDFYKKAKMVTTSNDAPLGYKNLSVKVAAPSVFIGIEAKLTTSIYFVAVQLALSAVQQSAS